MLHFDVINTDYLHLEYEITMPNNIDYKFLREREGGQKLFGYVPDSRDSKSGVTVATGFDLGQRNVTDLVKLNLSASLIEKLRPYLGAKKAEAADNLKKKPLMLTPSQANEIDKVVKSAHIKKVINNYNSKISDKETRFEDLPSGIQTAITSVSFQYGPNLQSSTPDFWDAVTKNNWNKTKEILNDFGDRYPSRRKLEADLIKIKQNDK